MKKHALIILSLLFFVIACHDDGYIEVPCDCETCYDGIKNQNETGIDCGGVCAPCAGDTTNTVIIIDTTFIYDTIFSVDTIVNIDTVIDTVYIHDTYTITIQPDPECGNDAVIHSINLFTGGDYEYMWAAAWTWNGGNEGVMRALIDFDLSSIPPGKMILVARLSLFGKPSYPDQHSLFSTFGTYNFGVIQRITTEWSEKYITWGTQPSVSTENQVFLHPSSEPDEDYLDIDVTNIIKDIYNNPESGYGMMISLHEEELYRMLAFCTSNHTDPELRPKLVVTFMEE